MKNKKVLINVFVVHIKTQIMMSAPVECDYDKKCEKYGSYETHPAVKKTIDLLCDTICGSGDKFDFGWVTLRRNPETEESFAAELLRIMGYIDMYLRMEKLWKTSRLVEKAIDM